MAFGCWFRQSFGWAELGWLGPLNLVAWSGCWVGLFGWVGLVQVVGNMGEMTDVDQTGGPELLAQRWARAGVSQMLHQGRLILINIKPENYCTTQMVQMHVYVDVHIIYRIPYMEAPSRHGQHLWVVHRGFTSNRLWTVNVHHATWFISQLSFQAGQLPSFSVMSLLP